MAKEYQSEKSPIFDSQKSKKTRRKLLKMSHIKAYKVDQTFCNTRYANQPARPLWLLRQRPNFTSIYRGVNSRLA